MLKTLKKIIFISILTTTLLACAEGESSSDGGSNGSTGSSNSSTASGDIKIADKGIVIEIGDEWRYQKGTSLPPSDWVSVSFNDSAWLTGNSGIGYGDGDDETDLSDMPGNYSTVYARKVFSYDDNTNINSLTLEIDYDDGFVAYINGQEVARANMPAGQPSFDTLASGAVDSGVPVLFNLDGFINLIADGDNVLAIEVHNVSLTSSDLSLLPRLLVNMEEQPVVTITGGGGTYDVGNMVTLSGTATDTEDGTITGNLAWSSSIDGAIPGTGGTVSTNTLSIGTHTITASVTDSGGNNDSDTTTVTVTGASPPLNQRPVVTITGGGGTYDEGSMVTLSGTATDTEDGTITSNLAWSSSIDGAIPSTGGTVSTNTLSIGTHTITATVTDSGGSNDSDTTTVTVTGASPPPNQRPVVTITGGGGTYDVGNMVTLSGTATDTEDGTITGNLAWSSSIDGAIPGTGGTVSTNTLSIGTHTITASVTDSGGNNDSDTTTVTVTGASPPLNQRPVVTITGGGGTYDEGSMVTLSGTATDTEDGTITSNLAWSSSIDGAIPSTGGTVSTNTLSIGTHTITATVIDSGGSNDSDTTTVTVSSPPSNQQPVVTITSGGGTYVDGDTVTLTGTATDAEDGTLTNSLTWSSSIDGAITGTGGTVNMNTLSAGTHTITATVTDSGANNDSDTTTVTINVAAPPPPPPPPGTCTLIINPGDSFINAFSQLSAGETLCLNDGTYNQAMDIPSNVHVRAVNDGMAEIDGGGVLGEEWSGALLQMKGSNSSVRGLKVHHASTNADACLVGGSSNTFQVMSCSHGGSHKHKIPLKISGSGNLIEDSWFYGEGRYVVQCFASTDHTIRRNVARWDSTAPNESDEPNAAFSIYACQNITIENNISIDYGQPVTEMRYGGDFYEPAHSGTGYVPNNNHWLGNAAINHNSNTQNNRAMRFDPDMETSGNVVKDFYVRDVGTGFVISPKMLGLVIDKCTMVNTYIGTSGGSEINCNGEADISARYIDRVKTTQSLFPWPNEALIKRDLCDSSERQSDWCQTNKSLTEYVLDI